MPWSLATLAMLGSSTASRSAGGVYLWPRPATLSFGLRPLYHRSDNTLTWLVTEEVLSEYKEVLTKFGVRRHLVGQIVNKTRPEFVDVRGESDIPPDP